MDVGLTVEFGEFHTLVVAESAHSISLAAAIGVDQCQDLFFKTEVLDMIT
jgi:hypothetical protein